LIAGVDSNLLEYPAYRHETFGLRRKLPKSVLAGSATTLPPCYAYRAIALIALPRVITFLRVLLFFLKRVLVIVLLAAPMKLLR
jgi:hypothetical protein